MKARLPPAETLMTVIVTALAQTRDEALEDAAKAVEEFWRSDNWDANGDVVARLVRALKSNPGGEK